MTRFEPNTQLNRRTVVNPDPGGRPIGRRQLLGRAGLAIWGLGAAATGLTVSGCTAGHPNPLPSTSAGGVATPTPTPLPGTEDAATLETGLADYTDAILARTHKLSAQQQRLLTLIRDAHRAHAAVLSSPTPFDLPTAPASGSPAPASPGSSSSASATPPPSSGSSPSASPTAPATGGGSSSPSASPTIQVPADAGAAIKELIKQESAAAADHGKRALAAAGPADRIQLLTLLWGSLSTGAGCYSAALAANLQPQATLVASVRYAESLPAPEVAITDALEQAYALIFGYQTALGHLYGAAADRARSSLSGYRNLRDTLSASLVAQKQRPPAPHPAYQLPIQPNTQTRAAELAGRMETAMLPYLGQWLATAKDRRDPLATLTSAATAAQAWTTALAVWPGWPTTTT